jgi:hypothetical protein
VGVDECQWQMDITPTSNARDMSMWVWVGRHVGVDGWPCPSMSEDEGIFLFRYPRLLVRTIVKPGTRCWSPFSGTQKPNWFPIRKKPWTRDHMRVPHSQKPGTLEPIVTCYKIEDKNVFRHQRVQKTIKTIFQVGWNSLKNGTVRNKTLPPTPSHPISIQSFYRFFTQKMNLRISQT